MGRPRFFSSWRHPIAGWTRGRLWGVYDRSYDTLFAHAALHRRWLADAEVTAGIDCMFSIGPGRGALELSLCRDLGCGLGYAESYPRYWRELESRFAEAGLQQGIVERHRGPYQGYVPGRRYPLILAIHSWYAFGYDADVLRKTIDTLTPGGSLVLTVTARDDYFFRESLRCPTFSAEELSRWAGDNGFEHELHRLRMEVPGARLVADGRLTEPAKGVVSFLKGRLWWQIPRAERLRITGRMLELSQNTNVERVYGLLHFRAPDA